MSLTPENARLAGQLQAQIDQLTKYVSDLTAAVAGAATIQAAQVRFNIAGAGNVLESDAPMSVSDSANLLNGLIAIYQSNIDALQAQLNAITA